LCREADHRCRIETRVLSEACKSFPQMSHQLINVVANRSNNQSAQRAVATGGWFLSGVICNQRRMPTYKMGLTQGAIWIGVNVSA